MSSYDRFPTTVIAGYGSEAVTKGWEAITARLAAIMPQDGVLAIEAYPGVDDDAVLSHLEALNPALLVSTRELFPEPVELTARLKPFLTDDRVFGRMCYFDLADLMEPERLEAAREQVNAAEGPVVVYGWGATLVHPGDQLVFFDMTRWEITLRYRAGMTNYRAENADEDSLRKIKRGYYVEWRVADKHKMTFFDRMDLFVDTVDTDAPKMLAGDAVRDGLSQIARRPFRLKPYFDPGVWGGQWMKRVCGLDPEADNYAWSFDGVPEENALILAYGDKTIELPAMDLTLTQPLALLGEDVYARFGAEYPIRFDFLDTVGGQNLSLQVHPTTEYEHRQFGMAYTQDESYYILDADEGATVYLGLKEGVDPDEMIAALREANAGGEPFDAERYVNRFPAKKHDHFLIPAGTIHCSGAGAMVLEISATPYNNTFKLWDWGRLGLDGKPRPVHVDHGSHVIRWDRTTPWIKENLVNAVTVVNEDEHVREEHTGLHELEFIETRRLWIEDEVTIDNGGSVSQLNLVEGERALVESLDGSFEPYEVHYAETFIVPASVKGYRLVNPTGERIGVIRAYVRKPQA
ncbi:class I mannose-6-phosphate isomerase [Enorma phocaeensis]|uniref:class I mannose-6-phosphate isomerase n=1 Tax=Enorma phocaeensis TaxID=1871019 RepID=UPI0023548CE2|nr:class I mannose-6-phosphate isomerase [Enorma phocaeensis]